MLKLREWVRWSAMAATLYRGSAIFLAIYVVGSAISFGAHMFMARTFGATSYGYFVYATSWMAILLLGCNFGLKPTLVRFVAAYRAHGEWALLRGLLRSSTWWTIRASLAMVILSATALWLVRPRPDELEASLLLIALAMPFMALSEVWCSAVRGLGAVSRSQFPASIVQHLLLGIVLAILFMLGGTRDGAASAAAAFLLATIGTLCFAGLFLRLELPAQVRASSPRYAHREWADVAAGNALISFVQAARTPLIAVIAGAYVEPQYLGYFVAAQKLANMVSLGLTGISGFASPLIAQYFALSHFSKLQRLAQLSARGSLGGALVVALVLMGAGHALLGLFGDGFETAYGALVVLLLGELAAAAAGPVGYFLTMTGRHMTATWIEAASSVLALGLALLLIPRLGILGAALVIALGSAARNIAMVVAVWRYHGLRSLVL